ncbi:hypothetical protein TNCV_2125081 [Trichonephila clavipes]|nr:hypothetical protein TNCV_2125081 [Trichonephila clavipes]
MVTFSGNDAHQDSRAADPKIFLTAVLSIFLSGNLVLNFIIIKTQKDHYSRHGRPKNKNSGSAGRTMMGKWSMCFCLRKPDEDVDTTLLFPNSVARGVCPERTMELAFRPLSLV